MLADARGIALTLGGVPLLVEVLVGLASFAAVLSKLVAGYALQALDHRRAPGRPSRGRGERGCQVQGRWAAGYALVDGETVLHAAAFTS